MTTENGVVAAEWRGPGVAARYWSNFKWSTLLWQLIYPARPESIAPTLPGMLLFALALGIGSAAYNTGNNILFIALSLLLSCLILSGVLSWLNFSGLRWRLTLGPSLRAGRDAAVGLDLRSAKKFLPSYGLWFDLRAIAQPLTATERSSENKSVREILAAVDKAETRTRLYLSERLDAGDETRVEWIFRPARRGLLRLELVGVGSLFPFGFLRKTLEGRLRREILVWPAPVEYRGWNAGMARRPQTGERTPRVGSSIDLFALRHYEPGDSHRLIHWKASARLGKLVVRQFAAESAKGFTLWLRTVADVWTRRNQFELLVGFAAALAEDLFRAGKLRYTAVNDEAPKPLRRLRDLELFMDQLAVVEPVEDVERSKSRVGGGKEGSQGAETGEAGRPARRNVITFAPDGARGVVAYVDGEKTAAA